MLEANDDGTSAIDALIDRYLNGTLSADDATQLLAQIERNPDMGRRLLDQFSVDHMLRDLSSVERKVMRPPAATQPFPRMNARIRRVRAIVLGITAAAALIGLTVLAVRHHDGQTPSFDRETAQTPREEPTTGAVAALARTVDAVWVDQAASRTAGTPLERGWLKLASGLVEIEFYCGARVLLEGPVELQLLSFNEAFCPRGKLTAEVPNQARGFRVNTPRGSVIDLGTAFGLSVNDDTSEVHVFKGEVDLVSLADARTGLKEGHAASIGRDGVVHLSEARGLSFTTAAGVDKLSGDAQTKRLEAWRTMARQLDADPTLIAHFDFEGIAPQPRALRNAAAIRGVNDAAIIGCESVRGRWPGKGALEIRSVGDRVRFEVPGELRSVTLAAWVRVDGLDRTFNSLMMSEGYSAGALHWQINQKGVVHIGIKGSDAQGRDYGTPLVFTPERFGRWTHLAVTVDSDARKVTHFVDGKPFKSEPMKSTAPLIIGRADLGNWTVGSHSTIYPVRNFSGRMDEFALFSRALNEDEIRKLYIDGAPGQ